MSDAGWAAVASILVALVPVLAILVKAKVDAKLAQGKADSAIITASSAKAESSQAHDMADQSTSKINKLQATVDELIELVGEQRSELMTMKQRWIYAVIYIKDQSRVIRGAGLEPPPPPKEIGDIDG